MISRRITPHRSGRRFITAIAAAGLIAGTLLSAGAVLAVHDLDFQLDGNTAPTCPAASTTCTPSQKDWDDMFTVATGGGTQTVTPISLPLVTTNGTFNDLSFTRDFRSGSSCTLNSSSTTFCTGDTTTYATGSKDTLEINTGWACNNDHNVNSKIDIMNAYSAAFTQSPNGHKLLYFGLEKNKDNGTNDAGFWFLQGSASCDASGGGHPNFSGTHVVGDVLIVAEYSTGGGVGNITAYKWVGGTTPLSQIASAVAPLGDCKNNTGADALCATTNSGAKPFNGNITTPWLTSDATLGVGNTVVPPDFFEGGIDLTLAFAGGGTPAPSCFNTFIGDTRSSTSLTATLFDFAIHQLGQCTTTLTTQQNAVVPPATSISIGAGTVSSGTDTATLTITGTPTWGGDLTWYLCGPVSTDGCNNTGVLVTTRAVSQASVPADFISGTATLSSVGRYCWTTHFEPNTATKNAGINPIDDTGANECFNVAPVTPSLVTSATCSADPNPCVLGSTLSDTATIGNTATQPGSGGPSSAYPTINPATPGAAAGGTITWQLFAGDCSTTRSTSPTSRTVSGNGGYSVTYTTLNTDPVGTYTFVANYSGNLPNTTAPSTTNTCASPGANEQVTVVGSSTVVTRQRWLPNDRITLNTNGPTMTGSMTATLYAGTFDGTAANCSAGVNATAVPGISYPFTLNNTASGTSFNTSNATFFVGTNPDGSAGGAVGNYFWLIHVDTQLSDPTDSCETSNVQITN